MSKQLTLSALVGLALFQTGLAQYPSWNHSGSLTILTTPEGANLPAMASEENFPLLVRLDKEWFDFSQAKTGGEDIRFSSEGKPVSYQIEEWDLGRGTASIWVRIPSIKGNARQEFKMFWGKADATSESSGQTVFNESNGYVSVWHMNDPVKDEVGTVKTRDSGTVSSFGVIGKARQFMPNKEIDGGTNVTAYPVGNNPHTSELWIKMNDENGGHLLRWGVCKANSIVQMSYARPPSIRLDCFYSLAGIKNESKLSLAQWTHVLYTYKKGDARIYINGVLDGFRTADNVSLTIGSPAEVKIGPWGFDGEMDEVRISKVARSADWAKLQYENQKPLQTVVGTLARPGKDFSVSHKKIDMLEGKSITVTAQAGGAQKVFWLIKQEGVATVAEVDRMSFTLNASRVTGDHSFILQFKAVFADGVKSLDIPVIVREEIPDPSFTLKAPATWDGRETIEIIPQIANKNALQAKNVGKLNYAWKVSGIAVIKKVTPDTLILKRAQGSGTMRVTATLSNGGNPITQNVQIVVNEPKKDAWGDRIPDQDEKPVDHQFYARDDKNEGTLFYNGTLSNMADTVFLKLYADGKLVKTDTQKTKADKAYAFTLKLKAGLITYQVVFGTQRGGVETVLNTITNLVCGDAYIIDGQSNAVAYNYHNVTNNPFTNYSSNFIRTYGSGGESGNYTTNGGWGNATLTNRVVNRAGGVHFVGYWGMMLASNLLANYKIPVCILNGAVGGTRIDQHLPDPVDPYHTSNNNYAIYRNLLRRVTQARLSHGIRGVLWHQGEADHLIWGSGVDWNYLRYQQTFVDMSAAWKEDMPNLKYYYIFQIFPAGCGASGTFTSDMLRDEQRTLPRLYSNMSVMSTLAFPTGSSTHFNIDDYTRMGLAMASLVARDNYGLKAVAALSAPNLQQAYFTSPQHREIALVFDQPMAWNSASTINFYLDRLPAKITSGQVNGAVIKLQMSEAVTNQTIAYVVDQYWHGNTNLLYGANGIAALTFYAVPIQNSDDRK